MSIDKAIETEARVECRIGHGCGGGVRCGRRGLWMGSNHSAAGRGMDWQGTRCRIDAAQRRLGRGFRR